MIQGTAVFTVRVRDASGGCLPLGDIGNGTDFGAWLAACMRDFESVSPDKTVSVRCTEPVVEGDETILTLEHRQTGEDAEILDAAGRPKMRLLPDDTRRTEHMALFQRSLPDPTGFLAVQVHNGSSAEALLAAGIRARLRTDFPGLALEIWPFVAGLVFRKAVDEDALKSTKIVRYEQPSDRAVAAVQRWVKTGTIGKLTPSPVMFGVLQRTRGLLPGQGARDEARASGGIVEIQDGIVPQKLEIVQEDGTRRTFVLQPQGPAFTEEAAFPAVGQGATAGASQLAELRRALSDVRPRGSA